MKLTRSSVDFRDGSADPSDNSGSDISIWDLSVNANSWPYVET